MDLVISYYQCYVYMRYRSTIDCRQNGQGNLFGSQGKVREKSGIFFKIVGGNPELLITEDNYIFRT